MKKRKAAGSRALAAGRRKTKMRASDTWVLVLFVIILLFIVFSFDASKKAPIEKESQILLGKLVAEDISKDGTAIVVGNQLDFQKVDELAGMSYAELKEKLGAKYDFAIYLEDEEGNIVPMSGKMCIGSPKARIDGYTCS